MSRKKVNISELNLKKISSRVTFVREVKGLKKAEFAQKLGISKSNVNGIENGEYAPSFKVLNQISALFPDINGRWLLTGNGPVYMEPPIVSPEIKLEVVDKHRPVFGREGQLENYVAVPLLKEAAAAGPPREFPDEEIEGFAVIYGSWVHNPDDYVCVRIKGDSMFPLLVDGSIVAINHTVRDLDSLKNKVTAFRVNGGVTIKWLRVTGEAEIVAQPENRLSGEFHAFHGEEIDQAIIGKVEWWWGRQK